MYLICATPLETPVTTPLALIVALPAMLLQTPPGVAFDKLILEPIHTFELPVICSMFPMGATLKLVFVVLTQPKLLVYVNVIFVTPAATEVTTPDVLFIVAMPASLLLQTPAPIAFESLDVVPITQEFITPPIEGKTEILPTFILIALLFTILLVWQTLFDVITQ